MRLKPKGALGWIALTALTATGSALAASWLIGRRARGRIHGTIEEVPSRAVALVLGAKVHENGAPSTALEDRLAAALDLYEAGIIEHILVSGDGQAPEYDEPAAMQRWLCERGVPPEHITADRCGLRTPDSMQRAVDVFDVTSAVICTQEFHLPRALFLARRAGIDAVGYAADCCFASGADDHLREFGAKAVAVIDSYVIRRRARGA